jgi:hypothetical protein
MERRRISNKKSGMRQTRFTLPSSVLYCNILSTSTDPSQCAVHTRARKHHMHNSIIDVALVLLPLLWILQPHQDLDADVMKLVPCHGKIELTATVSTLLPFQAT